jgi:hypothetical protein
MQKRRVFFIPLENLQTVIFLVNVHETPKQWAIAQENCPKHTKRQVFGRASQICTKCYGPCKSAQNPKIVGNSS